MITALKPFNYRLYPSGDFTIARREPKRDNGYDPFEGISVRDSSTTEIKRVRIEISEPERRDTCSELVRQFDLIDEWITLATENRIDEFSPALNLLFEKSACSLPSLLSGLWRQYYEIVERMERSRVGLKVRFPRGWKGISSKARKKVRSAVTLLQDRIKRNNLSFVTYTVPTCDRDILYKICDQWSEVVRQTQQNLTRMLTRKGLDPEVCGVIEIQDKRFQKYGVALPHLHFVCQGRTPKSFADRAKWDCSIPEFEDCYKRAIEAVAGVTLDFRAACNVSRVKKNAAAYLGKYLSKGSKDLDRYRLWGEKLPLPKAWYTCSASLMQKVNLAIRNIGIDGSWADFSRALDLVSCLSYKADYALDSGATVAIFGRCRAGSVRRFESEFLKVLQQFAQFREIQNHLAS